jgi:hypothetical protein
MGKYIQINGLENLPTGLKRYRMCKIYQNAGNQIMYIFLRYKWKAINCNDPSVQVMCMVKIPKCPNGYTWVYQLGQV